MFKTKKSKFIAITILTIVVLLCLNPLLGMVDNFFGLSGSKNQTIDGDIDVSVTLNVELNSYYVVFDFTFNASVTDVEIERINYQIYQNTINIYTYNGSYWPDVTFKRNVGLTFGDNLTCQGSVDLNYQLNGNPKNDTMNYNLFYLYTVREQDIDNYILSKYLITLAYVASFVILPLIWFFIIHPDFHELSKEEKEINDDYLNYLEKMKPKESDESSAKN